MPGTKRIGSLAALPRSVKGLVLLPTLLLALVAVEAAASDGPRITHFTIGSGGGVGAAGDYRLSDEVGQAIVGRVSSSEASIGGGFRHEVPRITYLPLLRR